MPVQVLELVLVPGVLGLVMIAVLGAERLLKAKAAEGDARSKALQGRGIADQGQAIVAGLHASADELRKSAPGTTAKDVMNLVLMAQYFDILAAHAKFPQERRFP